MSVNRNPFAHLRCAVLSDVGRKRKNNEDAAASFPGSGVWCVADGMGGGDDGEVASGAVVRAVDACIAGMPVPDPGKWYSASDVVRSLSDAIGEASAWIYDRAAKKKLSGCGSTVVGVAFDATCPGTAISFHVGDSRLYRLHGREIRQITKDHSVEELMGTKDSLSINPMFRGMILRAVGVERSVDIETVKFPVHEGDIVLLCSDGLSRMVSDADIAEIVRGSDGDMAVAAERLIEAANDAGGADNVTVALVGIGALPPPCATAETACRRERESTVTTGGEDRRMEDAVLDFVSAHWRGIALATVALLVVAVAIILAILLPEPREVSPVASVRSAEIVPSEQANATSRPVAAPNAVVSQAVKTNETKTVSSRNVDTKPKLIGVRSIPHENKALDPSETQDVREMQAAIERLKAERERSMREDEAAVEKEAERISAAKELSHLCYREDFRSFLMAVDRLLGEGASARLMRLGMELNQQRNDYGLRALSVEFANEVRSLAERVVLEASAKAQSEKDQLLVNECKVLAKTGSDASAVRKRLIEVLKLFSDDGTEGK